MNRIAATTVVLTLATAACTRPDAPAPSASATTAPQPPPVEASAMASPGPTLAQWAQGARLFDDLGTHTHRVTTQVPEAQAWFDQGLRLVYAFNHDEAARSFARAIELDPHCAMCWWGAGEALGPNYNMPAMPDRWKALWQSVQAAQRESANATPLEQALAAALATRYGGPDPLPPEAMQPYNVAYANAMREVARRFPDDDDVQVFFAEALMTANPWKLWSNDGVAAPGTDEIVATLERVLARNPQHPGANHYYIHAVEASPHPEKALAAAERLPALEPGAGHIVHMPSHIFQRVGRYAESAAANREGVRVDLAYMDRAKPAEWTYYGMYLAHNYQFLGYAAAMQGRSAESLQATRTMRTHLSDMMLHMGAGLDWYAAQPWFAMERFARWDELLAEPEPDASLPAMRAAWHYVRASAYAATGKPDDAAREKAALDAIATSLPKGAPAGLNLAADLVAVASQVAGARVALARGQRDDALALLRDAVAKEDRLAYNEPADWFVPVRHLLGAELLKAGKPAEAEAVYREDLRQHPGNGWALHGLAAAQKAQHRTRDAAATGQRLEAAWKDADVTLTASVL